MSDTSSVSTIYDDRSDQIQYTGPWYPIQSNDPGIHDSALTGVNGRASFSFSFLGSQISVYGVLRHEEANFSIPPTVFSAYSIDNVAMDTYNSVMPTGSDDTRGVLFFASGDLASGTNAHQLSVNITDATPTFPYWLDYIIVSSPSTNTSSPLLSSTGSVHIQSLSTDLRSTSSVPVSPSTKTPIPSHSAMPTLSAQAGNVVSHTAAGLIAGFVFGGILILCLLLGSLFLWRRTRKEMGSPDDGGGIHGVTPFMLSKNHLRSSIATTPMEPSSPHSISGASHIVRNRSWDRSYLPRSPSADPPVEDAEEASSDLAWSAVALRATSTSNVSDIQAPPMLSPRHTHAGRKGNIRTTTANGSTAALPPSINAFDGIHIWDRIAYRGTLLQGSTLPPVYTTR
ncbi:hypothetical protein PHLCEN_2v4283 [Hermanssonia centrifuga]|uniref:Uncharacterized protein n=1 Tax=Hermanssonia centrifuga TaxID=98765 RepID=A0A2R6PVV8_9APHY|nr:hypothetical protein PHLCEN_2v4283 [Hermanssonia centrifuga]